MDEEELDTKADSPLNLLLKEDLDPISIDELEKRIKLLENEISRIRAKISHKNSGLAAAEALFKS